MIRIALDTELEQPFTRHDCPDSLLTEERIIQVGYVVFDDQTGEFLKEVCKEVNIGVPISKFIQKLTGVTSEMVANGTTLKAIIDELHEDVRKFSASRKILTWGGGDQECIMKEIGPEYPWKLGKSAFNVKHLYQLWKEIHGQRPSGGLKKSMNNLNLKFEGKAHNALTDAKNTALIFMELIGRIKYRIKENENG